MIMMMKVEAWDQARNQIQLEAQAQIITYNPIQ
jgi:hypothetical protein